MKFPHRVQRELRRRDEKLRERQAGCAIAASVIEELIDEVDQRAPHGWIDEKCQYAQYKILVEARDRIRALR